LKEHSESDTLCMFLRGVRAAGSHTVTSALDGLLRVSPVSRHEFLALAGHPGLRPRLSPARSNAPLRLDVSAMRYWKVIMDKEPTYVRRPEPGWCDGGRGTTGVGPYGADRCHGVTHRPAGVMPGVGKRWLLGVPLLSARLLGRSIAAAKGIVDATDRQLSPRGRLAADVQLSELFQLGEDRRIS